MSIFNISNSDGNFAKGYSNELVTQAIGLIAVSQKLNINDVCYYPDEKIYMYKSNDAKKYFQNSICLMTGVLTLIRRLRDELQSCSQFKMHPSSRRAQISISGKLKVRDCESSLQ